MGLGKKVPMEEAPGMDQDQEKGDFTGRVLEKGRRSGKGVPTERDQEAEREEERVQAREMAMGIVLERGQVFLPNSSPPLVAVQGPIRNMLRTRSLPIRRKPGRGGIRGKSC